MNDLATLIGFADAAAIAALVLKRDIQRNLVPFANKVGDRLTAYLERCDKVDAIHD